MTMKNTMEIKRFTAIALLISLVLTSKLALADTPISAGSDQTGSSSVGSLYMSSLYQPALGETTDSANTVVQNSFIQATNSPNNKLVNANATPRVQAREMYVTSTGYNSEVGQTDDSPFITADGTHVFDGLVAANFLPMGTKIVFPDNFPGKVFTVHDRMNKRFSSRVDIWFPEHDQAIQWGKRTVRIQILGS